MKIIKTVVAVTLRLILIVPFLLLAFIAETLQNLFENLAGTFYDIATTFKQITVLPYVKDFEEKIRKAKLKDKERLLKLMKEN